MREINRINLKKKSVEVLKYVMLNKKINNIIIKGKMKIIC